MIYRLLKLAALGTIAVFAVLIYQRMPLTYGEYSGTKDDKVKRRALVTSRLPMVTITGTVNVEVDNTPFNPLPVTIEAQ